MHVQAEIAVFRKKYPTSTAIVSPSNKSNYFDVNRCELISIDKKLHLLKFDNVNPSSYSDLYCETMRDYQRYRENRLPQMLLVGLNCQDRKHKHPEDMAKLWKMYFHEHNGTGVHLFGIDNVHSASKECMNKYEPMMSGLYTRNLLNASLSKTSFVQEILKGTSLDHQKYDVIIDDGKYSAADHYMNQKRSFLSLWPHVQMGGLYFIENMKASSSEKGGLITGSLLVVHHSFTLPTILTLTHHLNTSHLTHHI